MYLKKFYLESRKLKRKKKTDFGIDQIPFQKGNLSVIENKLGMSIKIILG